MPTKRLPSYPEKQINRRPPNEKEEEQGKLNCLAPLLLVSPVAFDSLGSGTRLRWCGALLLLKRCDHLVKLTP